MHTGGSKNFPKTGTHLQILGDRSVPWRWLHTEDPHFCEWSLNLTVIRPFLVGANELIYIFVCKGKTVIVIVTVCRCAMQNIVTQATRCLGFDWNMFNVLRNTVLSKLYRYMFNPLNVELNPICHLLALLEAYHILHISWVRVKVSVVDRLECNLLL